MGTDGAVTTSKSERPCGAQWLRSLSELAGSESRRLSSLEEIQVALEEDETAYCVIGYTSPYDFLSERLLAGATPATALVGWQDFASSLISMVGKFWNRVTLIGEHPTTDDLVTLNDRLAGSG